MLRTSNTWIQFLAVVGLLALAGLGTIFLGPSPTTTQPKEPKQLAYRPRQPLETSGAGGVFAYLAPSGPSASLQEISDSWRKGLPLALAIIDRDLAEESPPVVPAHLAKATLHQAEGNPARAYEVLQH